jgi:hypothetical protein
MTANNEAMIAAKKTGPVQKAPAKSMTFGVISIFFGQLDSYAMRSDPLARPLGDILEFDFSVVKNPCRPSVF